MAERFEGERGGQLVENLLKKLETHVASRKSKKAPVDRGIDEDGSNSDSLDGGTKCISVLILRIQS